MSKFKRTKSVVGALHFGTRQEMVIVGILHSHVQFVSSEGIIMGARSNIFLMQSTDVCELSLVMSSLDLSVFHNKNSGASSPMVILIVHCGRSAH